MNSAVETLSPTRVKLTIEVPFAELEPSVDAAYRDVARKIRVKGFRPGKVPPPVVDRQVGRGAVLEEAMQQAVPRFYGDALRENDVVVLGPPAVEVTEFADGGQLVFTAEVDVRPQVELPAYDSIAVTVEDADVSDEAVEEQVNELRDLSATLTTVKRAAQDGDFVTLDLRATVDGQPVEGGEATGLSYEVGTEGLLDGLDEVVRGMSAGESCTFTTTLASGPRAGEQGDVAVAVGAVKVKELPELTDEFARRVSGFDTVAELRENLRGRLEQVRRVEQGIQARDHVLAAFVERVEMPLPDSLVEAQATARRAEVVRQIDESDLTLTDYLNTQKLTVEDFDRQLVTGAQAAVKDELVLDTVADKEQIGVTETELSEVLVRRAQRLRVPAQELAQQLVENNQIGLLVAEIRRGKALAMVLEAATITDMSGRPVDLEALREDIPAVQVDTDAGTGTGTSTETSTETGTETGTEADSDTQARTEPLDPTAPQPPESTPDDEASSTG